MSGSPGADASVISDVAADVAVEPTTPDRLRVRTADTDIEQQEEGEMFLTSATPDTVIVAGPIVITDVWTPPFTTSGVLFVSLHTKATCDSEVTRPHMAARNLDPPLHGVRMAVKTGEFLCARGTGLLLQWSGYRPYPSS